MENAQVKLAWKYDNENQWKEYIKSKTSWDFIMCKRILVSSAYTAWTFFNLKIAVFPVHKAVIKEQ